MFKNDKKAKKDASRGGAQGLLRRLGRRDAAAELPADAESAQSGMPEAVAPSAEIAAATMDALEVVSPSDYADSDDISDAELKVLFDRYLGAVAEPSEPADYDMIHQWIVDAEKRAGVDPIPETDVEKNIGEAERYVDTITERVETVKDTVETAALPSEEPEELFPAETAVFVSETPAAEETAVFETKVPKEEPAPQAEPVPAEPEPESEAQAEIPAAEPEADAEPVSEPEPETNVFEEMEPVVFSRETAMEPNFESEIDFEVVKAVEEDAPTQTATKIMPAADGVATETEIASVTSDSTTWDVPAMPTDSVMMKAFGFTTQTTEVRLSDTLFDPTQTQEAVSAGLQDTLLETKIVPTESTGSEGIREEEMPEEADPHMETAPDHPLDYEDHSQNESIRARFQAQYHSTKVRLILSAALVLLLGLLENVAPVSAIFGNNLNVVAIDWVLTLAAAILVADRLKVALKLLVRFEFDCDTVTLFSFVLSLVATGVTLFTAQKGEVIFLYNFPFAVCVFLNLLYVFITFRRDLFSFKILSSEKTKNVLVRVSSTVPARASSGEKQLPEKVAFPEQLEDEGDICAVEKAEFVSSFFAHRNERANFKFFLKIFIPECLIFSILFFVVSYFVLKNGMAESLGTAYASFLMSAPFSAFIAYAYPLYRASRRAYTYRSAILGEKTYENYEDTAVIAFRDEEVFPAAQTKIERMICMDPDNMINSIYYAASLYAKLGGPLAEIFRRATLDEKISEEVEILELGDEGVAAVIDGKHISIGMASYMESQCFETIFEPEDRGYEGKTNKRILYLACDQVTIAKFYIQYAINVDFLQMVQRLADADMGISIRTADPCIDRELFHVNGIHLKAPLKVMKGILPEIESDRISAKAAGIVSTSSIEDLLKTFRICGKIANVKKVNFVLKTVASILGIAVMVLVLFTGNAGKMLSIFPVLYQLFWIIPIFITSKLYV